MRTAHLSNSCVGRRRGLSEDSIAHVAGALCYNMNYFNELAIKQNANEEIEARIERLHAAYQQIVAVTATHHCLIELNIRSIVISNQTHGSQLECCLISKLSACFVCDGPFGSAVPLPYFSDATNRSSVHLHLLTEPYFSHTY